MKLPEDTYGNLDMRAIEDLLTVGQFLHLLFVLRLPDKTLYQPSPPTELGSYRSLKKLLDWGLLSMASAATPEHPRRFRQTLTLDGQLLAMTYANEADRLTQRVTALLFSPSAD